MIISLFIYTSPIQLIHKYITKIHIFHFYRLIKTSNHKQYTGGIKINLQQLEYFKVCNDKDYDKKISYAEFIGYTPKVSVESNEGSMLAGLVAAGAGIAIILNTPMINTNKISVIKIKDDLGRKNIYMGWNKSAYFSKNAKE